MVLTAFALRFALILVQQLYHFSDNTHHFLFGGETGSIARSVAEGEGFCSPFLGSTGPTAWIGPIYVYLLAAIFELFGVFTQASATVILSVNAAFSALTAPVIYMVGVRTGNKTAGVWAGWSWAILPTFMTLSTSWIWETSLSALLMTLALLFAIELSRGGTWKKWIAFGGFWGLSGLTNPALLTFFPISLLWISLRHRRDQRPFVKRVAVTALVFVTTMSPWLVRNRIVFGQWVFVRSNFGFEFYLDNHAVPEGQTWSVRHPSSDLVEYQKYKSMGEIPYINFYTNQALSYVRQNPQSFVKRTGHRFVQIWTGGVFAYLSRLSAPPRDLQMVALLSLISFFGMVLAVFRRMREWPLFAALMLLYPLPYYVTMPSARYRHPIEPVMVMMSAYFCLEAGRILRKSITPRVGSEKDAQFHVESALAQVQPPLPHCTQRDDCAQNQSLVS